MEERRRFFYVKKSPGSNSCTNFFGLFLKTKMRFSNNEYVHLLGLYLDPILNNQKKKHRFAENI